MHRSLRAGPAVLAAAALCLTSLTVGGTTAAAQTPTTVGPNVNVSRRAANQTEGTVAVDPRNTQRIFVAANDESLTNGVFSARSADGGQTWTPLDVGTGAAGDGFPAACCDPSASWDEFGNLFFTYLAIDAVGARQVVLLVSTDGGQTFAQVAILDTVGRLDQPTVTTGAGSVWVTWRNGANSISAAGAAVTGAGTASIGAFGAAQVVPGSAGGNYGDVAVGPGGRVMVTYQVPNAGEGPATIFTHVDADGLGAGAFGAQQTATTTNVGGFDFIPPQPDRSVDAEAGLVYDRSGGARDGRVYLVYTEEDPAESGDTDVLVRTSDDDGANWSAPVQANDDAGTNSQFLPRISLDQGTGNIAVTWHDARSDTETTDDGPNTDVQFWGTFSLDGGATFEPNVQISAGTSDEDGAEPPVPGLADIDYGDYTGNSFAGGRMHAVWADNSNSTGDNPDGTLTRFDIYTALVTPPVPNRPPDCGALRATPNRLWPATLLLRPVTVAGGTDPDGDPVTHTVSAVTQDEPVTGLGSGVTDPDAALVPHHSDRVLIRAERNPFGDGRVYRVTVTVDDGSGGTCTGVVTVQVPRTILSPAVDSAPPSYNSLVP